MATVYDKSSLFLAPSGVSNGTVFTQKPVPIYGPELVTNGDFATDSDWSKGTGWTISGGTASFNGGADAAISQSSVVTSGTEYKVLFTISDLTTSGSLQLRFGSTGSVDKTINKNGTYYFHLTADGTTLYFRAISGFNGSIDNVSVQEVLTDGADFTFSRGSNLSATRVNADGLIEKGRENIVLHSNDFSQSSWAKLNGASVSSTQVADPFGGTNAWELTFATNNDSRIQQQVTTVNNTVYAFSVWARVTSGTKIVNLGAVGNLQQKTLTTTWQRIQAYAKETDVYGFPQIRKHSAEGEYTIQIYGFQLELGTAATDYIGSAATTGKAGLLENTPRLDYSGGATCPSLLLEPSRTNVLGQSEYFGDSSWTKTSLNITTNATTSPSGFLDASKLLPTATSGQHKIDITKSVSSGADVALSAFVKKGEYQYCCLYEVTSAKGRFFDLSNGTKGGTFGSAPTTSDIEPMGNDWYKISITTSVPSSTARFILYVCESISSTSFTGNGSSGIYAYGTQLEAGSYPTSYIPTYGTSQTRSSDASQRKDYDYSTSNSYTLFFDFNLDNQPLQQNVNSKDIYASSIHIMSWRWFDNYGKHCFVPYFNNDGVYPFGTNVEENITDNGKVVMSVSGGTYKLFLRSDGTTTMQTTTGKTAGQFNKFGSVMGAKERINQIVFFDETLSDTDCEILTGATTYETFEEMALALNYTVYE